jgi:hypothetical protein
MQPTIPTYPQWPTRAEWTESQRSLFRDHRFDKLDFCQELSAYASPDEIQALVVALRTLWKRKGADLRALHVPAALYRQRREDQRAYHARHKGMLPAEQKLLQTAFECTEECRLIQESIKYISAGSLLERWDQDLKRALEDPTVDSILEPIQARYETACRAAIKKREAEILATPIDDQAWAEELKRRAGPGRHVRS